MALTREDGVRAGMLLLSPGNYDKIKFVGSIRTLESFLNLLERGRKEAVFEGFSWMKCAKFLRGYDFDISEDHFEEYHDWGDHEIFFDTMFQTMLRPPLSKPLEDYL